MNNWNPQPLDPGLIKLHRRGKGAPLVLIHCLGMSWRFWDVLEPLTDRYELIAYSLPGHHDTPLPAVLNMSRRIAPFPIRLFCRLRRLRRWPCEGHCLQQLVP